MVNNVMEWLQPLLVLLILGALFFLLLRQTLELSRVRGVRAVAGYTLEACGDRVERREFREGDYVGLVTGSCEGGPKRIIGIFVEEVGEQQRRA
ncbi:MAG: hypothetical protein N3F67_00915 [Acidilobaceae archaeon]|nr:hypothetical protein [Acidilobaceae archaeon]